MLSFLGIISATVVGVWTITCSTLSFSFELSLTYSYDLFGAHKLGSHSITSFCRFPGLFSSTWMTSKSKEYWVLLIGSSQSIILSANMKSRVSSLIANGTLTWNSILKKSSFLWHIYEPSKLESQVLIGLDNITSF